MSDLAPGPVDGDAAPSPTETSRPPNPTEAAPQPNPAQTYSPRAGGTPSAKTYLPMPAAGDASAGTTERSPEGKDFTRLWKRARLQAVAVLGAAMFGIAFGQVAAAEDYRMQIFFSAVVGIGLFFVFSALATQLKRNRRHASRH